jgi:hypothetical protein
MNEYCIRGVEAVKLFPFGSTLCVMPLQVFVLFGKEDPKVIADVRGMRVSLPYHSSVHYIKNRGFIFILSTPSLWRWEDICFTKTMSTGISCRIYEIDHCWLS